MLGIFILYFLGKSFYDLANRYGKSKWGYAIGGIAMYYISGLLFGIILAIGAEFTGSNFIEETSEFLLNLIGIVIGLGTCFGLYTFLERNLTEKSKTVEENLNDMLNEIGVKEDQ